MTSADALRELTRRRECPTCRRHVNVRLAGAGPLVDESGRLRLVVGLHGPGMVGVFCEGSGEPVAREEAPKEGASDGR